MGTRYPLSHRSNVLLVETRPKGRPCALYVGVKHTEITKTRRGVVVAGSQVRE